MGIEAISDPEQAGMCRHGNFPATCESCAIERAPQKEAPGVEGVIPSEEKQEVEQEKKVERKDVEPISEALGGVLDTLTDRERQRLNPLLPRQAKEHLETLKQRLDSLEEGPKGIDSDVVGGIFSEIARVLDTVGSVRSATLAEHPTSLAGLASRLSRFSREATALQSRFEKPKDEEEQKLSEQIEHVRQATSKARSYIARRAEAVERASR